jgi:hypothetical protein
MFRSTLVTLFLFAAASGVVHAQTGGPTAVAPEEPETVVPIAPAAPASLEVWEAANRATGVKLLVSIEQRRLWMMDGGIVLFTAPVAVGRSVVLEYEGNVWNFATPLGQRTVRLKEKDPVWIPPDWHYVELAIFQGWKLEAMTANRQVRLSDGSSVAMRGRRLGRVLADGSFVAVPLGEEAVFEGTLFIPPIGSENRRVSGPLGRYKLDLGGAYYLHGTEDQGSIGTAATHGCIRLGDDDIEYLYRTVAVGTPVFLY